eukprot:scaffold1396_cov252-Pinguiococcus_pyrenoidosus.AAC.5
MTRRRYRQQRKIESGIFSWRSSKRQSTLTCAEEPVELPVIIDPLRAQRVVVQVGLPEERPQLPREAKARQDEFKSAFAGFLCGREGRTPQKRYLDQRAEADDHDGAQRCADRSLSPNHLVVRASASLARSRSVASELTCAPICLSFADTSGSCKPGNASLVDSISTQFLNIYICLTYTPTVIHN